MAIADEIDRLGFVSKKPEFSFFLRTTTDVCNAVADREKSGRKDILRQHLARIDDRRLRRAFLAVFDLESQGDQSAPQDRHPAVLRSVQSKKARMISSPEEAIFVHRADAGEDRNPK
jgi:hypothetical protein